MTTLITETVAADNEAADRGALNTARSSTRRNLYGGDPNIKVDVDSIEIDVERKSLSIRGKTGSTSDVDNIESSNKIDAFANRNQPERKSHG